MENIKKGRICEIRKGSFFISFEGEELKAVLKGSYVSNGGEYPVVGDYVTFIYNPCGDSVITGICDRRNILRRPNQSGHSIGFVKNLMQQDMVANFDYVFIVTALNNNYNYNRVARYVSLTLEADAIPVVVLTKSDLCSNPGRYVREIEGLSDRVRVHAISAIYGIGLEELEEYFQPGKTIVLIGSSGAGKSTLVNAVAGEEVMKTSEIREEDSKGRHTTTHRQAMTLKNGVTIIDTPGMREIGMHYAEEGIADTFADITELEKCCRFSDCRHVTEPGCAIKAALQDGTLSSERYELYKNLMRENTHNAKLKKDIAVYKKQLSKLKAQD